MWPFVRLSKKRFSMYKTIQVHDFECGEHVMYRCLECLRTRKYFVITCDNFQPYRSGTVAPQQEAIFQDLMTDILLDEELGRTRRGFPSLEAAIENFRQSFDVPEPPDACNRHTA